MTLNPFRVVAAGGEFSWGITVVAIFLNFLWRYLSAPKVSAVLDSTITGSAPIVGGIVATRVEAIVAIEVAELDVTDVTAPPSLLSGTKENKTMSEIALIK